MPLQAVTMDGVGGLQSEQSPTAGSTFANPSSAQLNLAYTHPTTLSDCRNVDFSRDGLGQSRKGHPLLGFCNNTGTLVQPGAVFSFTSQDIFVIPYTKSSNNSGSFISASVGGIANQDYVQRLNGLASTLEDLPTWLIAGTHYPSQFTTSNVPLPRAYEAGNAIYYMASNGMFRSIPYSPYVSQIIQSPTKYVPLTLKIDPASFSVTCYTPSNSAQAWMQSGQAVDIVFQIEDENCILDSGEGIQGPQSARFTLYNYDTPKSIQVANLKINTIGLLDNSGTNPNPLAVLLTPNIFVRVYRTVQYNPQVSSAPPQLYLCKEVELASLSPTWTAAFATFSLDLNDDGITQFKLIYTDSSRQGQTARNTLPPAANDVVMHKGYAVYASVTPPAYGTLGITSLPANTDSLTVGTVTQLFPGISNNAVAPNSAGYLVPPDSLLATASSTWTTNYNGTTLSYYPLTIRALVPDEVSTSTGTSVNFAFCDIVHSVTDGVNVSTTSQISNVTVNVGVASVNSLKTTFSTGNFVAPGFCAFANEHGDVVGLFSYQTVTANVTSATVTFGTCVAYGVPFTDSNYKLNNGGITGGYYSCWYLTGSSIQGLEVFPIGSAPAASLYTNGASHYPTQAGFSLIPTYATYPTLEYIQDSCGLLFSLSLSTKTVPTPSPYSGNYSVINARIAFTQEVFSPGELLDLNVKYWAIGYNAKRTTKDPVAYVNTGTGPGTIYFEGLMSGQCLNNTTNTTYYDIIWSKSGTYGTEPVNSTTLITPYNLTTTNGITISKINRPELVPESYMLDPLLIGKANIPIQRIAALTDGVYVFKPGEGIYRVALQDNGSPVASVISVVLIDDTTFLAAPESLQVLNDSIYFLSQKGFCSISTSGINLIGHEIATEVRNAYSCSLNSIRSSCNPLRREYYVYFPIIPTDLNGPGITYVYDVYTGKWSKSDVNFQGGAANRNGVWTTFEMERTLSGITPTATLNASTVYDTSVQPLVKSWVKQDLIGTLGINDPANQYDYKVTAQGTYNNSASGLLPNEISATLTSTVGVLKDLLYSTRAKQLWISTKDVAGAGLGGLYRITFRNVVGDAFYIAFQDYTTVPTDTGTSQTVLTTLQSGSVNCFYYVGVNMSMSFNPFTAGNNGLLKKFSSWHVSTLGTPNYLGRAFRVDTQLNFNTPTYWDPTAVVSRTTWRTNIPLASFRGRYIERKVIHNTPLEYCIVTGQTIVYSETSSTRVQLKN